MQISLSLLPGKKIRFFYCYWSILFFFSLMFPFQGLFLLIFIILILFYNLSRIFTILHHPVGYKIRLLLAIGFGFLLFFLTLSQWDSVFGDICSTLSSWILVGNFLFLFLCVVEQLLSHFVKIKSRIFLIGCILFFGVGLYFALVTKITHLEIHSSKITEEKKILVVSDLHVEHLLRAFHVKKIKNLIEQEHPDFVLLLGDLFNKANSGYVQYYHVLKDLDTPLFAIEGNHDLMGYQEILHDVSQNTSLQLLQDDIIEVQGITLIGLKDKSNQDKTSLGQIISKLSSEQSQNFTLLMTHQPLTLESLAFYPIDLELAGHTHNGQFWGMHKVVERVNTYNYGEYTFEDKKAFVTQGIGTRGLPFRLGTQSEVVMLHLLPYES